MPYKYLKLLILKTLHVIFDKNGDFIVLTYRGFLLPNRESAESPEILHPPYTRQETCQNFRWSGLYLSSI